jgi:hypothetical protein
VHHFTQGSSNIGFVRRKDLFGFAVVVDVAVVVAVVVDVDVLKLFAFLE